MESNEIKITSNGVRTEKIHAREVDTKFRAVEDRWQPVAGRRSGGGAATRGVAQLCNPRGGVNWVSKNFKLNL